MARAYQFGEWLVQPDLNRISRAPDEEKQLERKAMDVLAYLLAHPGEVTSSAQLLEAVWPDRIVEENAIYQRISRIRRALGDSIKAPAYIENVPRRGYRTVATVSIPQQDTEATAALLLRLRQLTPPFPAYQGDDSYFFVCYAHVDRAQIFPELEFFNNAGVHLWYDEGISPGQDWTEEIARAINGCTQFIYYVSPASVESKNCRDEVQYAQQRGKPVLQIEISPTELPDGLQLTLGQQQAVRKYGSQPELYQKKLFEVLQNHQEESTTRSASATINAAAEAEQSTPQLLGWRKALVRFSHWLSVSDDRISYPAVAFFGTIPLLIAYVVGVWPDGSVTDSAPLLKVCDLPPELMTVNGFGGRWNWLLYPLLLPVALFFLRYIIRHCYGHSASSALVSGSAYHPLESQLKNVLQDWRNAAFVVAATLLLTGFDQYDVVRRLWYSPYYCPGGPLDWGWYAMVSTEITTSSIVWLTIWTTAEQMLITAICCATIVYLYRFNEIYMNVIYVRSSTGAQRSNTYVLDFDDPDRRFGLGKLSSVFDLQLFACVMGGFLSLLVRVMNIKYNAAESVVDKTVCSVYDGFSTCAELTDKTLTARDAFGLFPDFTQMLVIFIWLAFLLTVLWVANVKLLPFKTIADRDGRIAYLQQLIPPGTKYDRMLNGNSPGQVDEVARQFRHHHFWPTGDQRATDALSASILIVFFMIIPIFPNTAPKVIAVICMIISSIILARAYLRLQKHRLRRVDESLVAQTVTES